MDFGPTEFYRFTNTFHLVTRQVIHYDDVSGSQRGNGMLPHPCQKDATVDPAIDSQTIDSQWCGETGDT